MGTQFENKFEECVGCDGKPWNENVMALGSQLMEPMQVHEA